MDAREQKAFLSGRDRSCRIRRNLGRAVVLYQRAQGHADHLGCGARDRRRDLGNRLGRQTMLIGR